MRMMMITLAAVLLASPLSAQAGKPADAWRRMPVPDARLRVDFADAAAGAANDALALRLSLEQMVLVGFTSDA